MALHPDLQAFLELANAQASTRPRMSQMTAAQARAAYDRATLALDLPGADLVTEELALPAGDGAHIRAAAGKHGVPLLTTGAAGLAAVNGMVDRRAHPLEVRPLQEYHRGVSSSGSGR